MAKIYQGNVSVVKNTAGKIAVSADTEGKFTQANVQELYTVMCKLAKQHKTEAKFFRPETGGDTPVLMADRWGKPYIALLPERKAPSVTKVTVQKLA